MILGFKEQFKPLILDGTKIHTIREDKNDRWKAGNIIHFATGIRTKKYNCFKKDSCKFVQKVEIIHIQEQTWIKIDNCCLTLFEEILVAQNDGFKTLQEFYRWFNKDFRGKIIHWTDFKY